MKTTNRDGMDTIRKFAEQRLRKTAAKYGDASRDQLMARVARIDEMNAALAAFDNVGR